MRVVCVLILAIACTAQTPAVPSPAARDQLKLGMQAYKNGRFEEAIEHFGAAVSLAPEFDTARLYLGTAYAQTYIPGADTPENMSRAELAIREFQHVASSSNVPDAAKLRSMKSIASLYFNMKKFDEAVDWYQRYIAVDADDPETYYSLGVIRWTQAYMPRMKVRAELGLQPTDNLPPGPACAAIRAQNEKNVDDGIRFMTKALELRHNYDDAMAYLNLLHRERADYECDDLEARAADLKKADQWVDLTLATKKLKAGDTVPLNQTGNTGSGGGGGSPDRQPHLR